MSTRNAMTIGVANLRSGPGVEYQARSLLQAGTTLLILNEQGDWLKVRTPDNEGFVLRQMIVLAEQQVDAGFLVGRFAPEVVRSTVSADHDEALADVEAATCA